MSDTFGIAGVQMEVISGEGNIDRMEKYLKQIQDSQPWVEMVVFSELSVFGNDPKWAQSIPGSITAELSQLAKKYNKWLIPGSISESTKEGVYNTALVFNPQGEIVTQYRKMYPWKPAEQCLSGNKFCVFDIPGRLSIGLCICYDQWFPEVIRQLTWMGADVIVCPTMTGTPDRHLEVILSQANAISNQIYFMSINGLGHGGNGQSVVVDPEGLILDKQEASEAILTLKVDAKKVKDVRESGTLGVCQALKSFRDGNTTFPVYQEGVNKGAGFCKLNALIKN
ncbi:MAG: carbon-nitrogen hydrolase family protein [Deltaproteobacteria bacterium]|nr:carbon-nitrogen hydrolase family protein [Deltaproteobacteria bacterium]